jgi:site-specific recombinase XerC
VTAHQFALQKAEEITLHGTAYGTLPKEVYTAYRIYREQVTLLAKGGKETPSFEMLVRGALTSLTTEIMPRESAVADGIERYLASRKADLSDITYVNLRAPLQLLARSLGDRAMRSITPEMIERWLSDLPRQRSTQEQEPKKDPKYREPGLSASTLYRYRRVLGAFFSHAEKQRWITENPVKIIRYPVSTRSKLEVLSPEQAHALLTAASQIRPSVLPVLALQMFAGLRLTEATQIKPYDILAGQDETFLLPRSKVGSREVPACESLRAWLGASPCQADSAWQGSLSKILHQLKEIFISVGSMVNVNSPRYTYLRYRMEMTEDVMRIATESGTHFELLHGLSHIPVAPGAAENFFDLRPKTQDKIKQNP